MLAGVSGDVPMNTKCLPHPKGSAFHPCHTSLLFATPVPFGHRHNISFHGARVRIASQFSHRRPSASPIRIACRGRGPEVRVFQTWRAPRWGGDGGSGGGWGDGRDSRLFAKTLCTFVVSVGVMAAWVSYFRLGAWVAHMANEAGESTFGRSVSVGRLVRVSPLGAFRLANCSLERTQRGDTGPDLHARSVDVAVKGLWKALFFKAPLKVNAALNRPTIELRQRVAVNRKGLPVGEWDPGIRLEKPNSDSDAYVRPSVMPGSEDELSNSSVGVFPSSSPLRVQPGRLLIRRASVFLYPAEFQEYGHGSETVHVQNANAQVVLPVIETFRDNVVANDTKLAFDLKGLVKAHVRGHPVDGGKIDVECEADASSLLRLKPGDPVARVRVVGSDIHAKRIASFLNLPFRADAGRCSGSVDMDFVYMADTQIPEMRGEGLLDSVSLRFHPDPRTPECTNVSGKLQFEGKNIFMDGPSGDLGTLPLTVVGNIDLEEGYNLMGYVRTVDANNVLDTFEVEKFVPVKAQLKGEARLTGPLDEPYITGWAHSSGDETVFDRLPLETAAIDFSWDSVAGLLKFTDIRAKVIGSGSISGEGALYFDMTKETPYGTSRPTHHERSPKAKYWNAASGNGSQKVEQLPPEPADELEIDPAAQLRSYDSMRFDFRVQEVDGGDLLARYGGKSGEKATKAIGLVSGEGVLAGHAKNANCRVVWRSVTPPPTIFVHRSADPYDAEDTPPGSPEAGSGVESSRNRDNDIALENEDALGPEKSKTSDGSASKDVQAQEDNHQRNMPSVPPLNDRTAISNASSGQHSATLGGGEYQGLVYIKLGDLPAARRIKVRTTVKNLDARRLAWGDSELRQHLAQTPLLKTSMDTYFKGVLYQRAILPPGCTVEPRTPQMELLGADGALAVRKLTMNKAQFQSTLTGSFSFSASDFALSLQEAGHVSRNRNPGLPRSTQKSSQEKLVRTALREKESRNALVESPEVPTEYDGEELTVSASLKGDAYLCLRQGQSEFVAAAGPDEAKHRILDIFARDVSVEDYLGEDFGVSGGGSLSGIVNADLRLDLDDRFGDGTITVLRPRLGAMRLNSMTGNLVWRNREVMLKDSVVRYRRSEYQIDAKGQVADPAGLGFGWEIMVNIARANVREVASLLRSGNAVASAMQQRSEEGLKSRPAISSRPTWIQRLSQTAPDGVQGYFDVWEVPPVANFAEQMLWFQQSREEKVKLSQQDAFQITRSARGDKLPGIADVEGSVSGRIVLSYDSGTGATSASSKGNLALHRAPTAPAGSALLQSLLDQLARTSFSFDLSGSKWRIGSFDLGQVTAKGQFQDGVLSVGPLSFAGPDGFAAYASGKVASTGTVKGAATIRRAPAALFSRYSRAPVQVTGFCNGRVEVEGGMSNPTALGRVVWTEATLNRQHVYDARTDLGCANGRCTLNAQARLGGRRPIAAKPQNVPISTRVVGDGGKREDEYLVSDVPWGKDVVLALRNLAAASPGDIAQVASSAISAGKGSVRSKHAGEPLQVAISAPVRFYALNYLQRTAPKAFWSAVEPLLRGSFTADDEWILMDLNVKKYGLVLLNAALPELGWTSGSSDVKLRVSGTLPRPVLNGRVSVWDGVLWPGIIPEPLEGLRGELLFNESGLVSFKSVSGRVRGRSMHIHGDMLLSERHAKDLEYVASFGRNARTTAESVKDTAMSRKEKRILAEERTTAAGMLSKASRGVSFDTGEVPVSIKDTLLGNMSGKVVVKGTVAKPALTGWLSMSKGVVFLSNPSSLPDLSLEAEKVRPSRELIEKRLAREKKIPSGPRKNSMGSKKTDENREAGFPISSTEAQVGEGVRLRGLRLSLGRDMQIVYPYVLNLEAGGHVVLSGSLRNIMPSGKIVFSRGHVNLLASRMELKRDADNYARFNASSIEPVLNLSLEDRDVVVQIRECLAREWADHLTLSDKHGVQLDSSAWGRMLLSRLESMTSTVRGAWIVPRALAEYVAQSLYVGGRALGTSWRLSPAIISAGASQETQVSDLGLGVEVDVGKIGVGVRRSVGGRNGLGLKVRPGEWLRLELEAEEDAVSSEIEIKVPRRSWGRRQKDS